MRLRLSIAFALIATYCAGVASGEKRPYANPVVGVIVAALGGGGLVGTALAFMGVGATVLLHHL